jgi:hypothetical protein
MHTVASPEVPMNNASLSRFLPFDCNRSVEFLKDRLAALGLLVIRSFDLQAARSVQENRCVCPHHGTNSCTCQWVVLLVYGNCPEPLTLILDGQEGRTWLNVVDQPGQRADPHLAQRIFATVDAEMVNIVAIDQDGQADERSGI